MSGGRTCGTNRKAPRGTIIDSIRGNQREEANEAKINESNDVVSNSRPTLFPGAPMNITYVPSVQQPDALTLKDLTTAVLSF